MREEVVTDNLLKMNEYFSEMSGILQQIDLREIDEAINIIYRAWLGGNQVFIIGNGGSASTATHFACDLTKTTIVDGKKRFKVLSLVDNVPLVSALTNDDGYEKIFEEQLKSFISPGDILIALSVHGGSGKGNAAAWSQNLLRAINLAGRLGAKTIGLSGFGGGAMKNLTDVCMTVPSYSTPHVESVHLALEHLICKQLKWKILDSDEGYIS